VLPDSQLFRQVVPGRSVLVTGAGGSIGSEVCRQVAALGPKRLVLFERSEFALYEIEMELGERFPDLEVAAVLGSVLDRERLRAIYERFEVDSVYHAAAYKHVPLVEQNPVEGIANNVFGTLTAAEVARDCGVYTFVLISTDKAVRPSNVMGASKRIAELGCLMLSEKDADGKPPCTRFAMVRFGNVLDSAGSVVPLFRKQIALGGPVTVTHPEVTRYFMTIPEAAQLVVQASALGEGGEVFLLDMGEPVRIRDLAERMISLATAGTNREIKIDYTGLRPGEKLVEELLVEASNSQPTGHPKIFKAVESGPPSAVVAAALVRLRKALERSDLPAVYALLEELVEGYRAPTEVNDVLERSGSSFSFGQSHVTAPVRHKRDSKGSSKGSSKGPRPLAG
jgi:FlaA1/EpsC-like NDP-sugar epimerase